MAPFPLPLLGRRCTTVQAALRNQHENSQRIDVLVPTRSDGSASWHVHLRKLNPSILNGEMDWTRLHATLETEYKERYEVYKKMSEAE